MKKINLFLHKLENLSDKNVEKNLFQLNKILEIIYELFSHIKKCNTKKEVFFTW
jgi:hypothetical protein